MCQSSPLGCHHCCLPILIALSPLVYPHLLLSLSILRLNGDKQVIPVILFTKVMALPTSNNHHIAARLCPLLPPVVFLFYATSLPLNWCNQCGIDQSHTPSALVLASTIATFIINNYIIGWLGCGHPSVAMALLQRRPLLASGPHDRLYTLMFRLAIAMWKGPLATDIIAMWKGALATDSHIGQTTINQQHRSRWRKPSSLVSIRLIFVKMVSHLFIFAALSGCLMMVHLTDLLLAPASPSS